MFAVEAPEKAKKELSRTNEYEVNIPFITADADGPKHFELKLTRAKLEELVAPLNLHPWWDIKK